MRTMAASQPGAGEGVGAHHVVVLLPDPALGAEVGGGKQRVQIAGQIAALECRRVHRRAAQRLRMRAVVKRRLIGQRAIGNFRHDFAVMAHAQLAVAGHAADGDGVETPLAEDLEDFFFAALVGHEQHALLRFREHDFVRRHAGFALRHAVQIDLDAGRRRGCPSRRWSRSARPRPCPECRRSRRSSWLRCRLRAAAFPETDRPPAHWAASASILR